MAENNRLHLVEPGEDIAGGFTEAEHMLGHDPDEQPTFLQPGAGVNEPLIFKTAVLIIIIIGWVNIQQVVTTTRSNQIEVTVMENTCRKVIFTIPLPAG
jgi:hypothetical protein